MMDFFLKGGPIMYPLLACSIIAMTVIIERAVFWVLEDARRNRPLVDEVLELCRTGDWQEIRKRIDGSRDHVITVLVSGILHRGFSMTKAMEAS